MSRWKPCKRADFVRKLRGLGFEGPYAGGRHHFVVIAQRRLAVPSNAEYSVPELREMLRQVETLIGRAVTLEEWERL